MKYVYKWSGEYWGFIQDEYLFSKNGMHKGFLVGINVYREDGTYLGALTEDLYIMRSTLGPPPPLEASRPYPAPPMIPPEPLMQTTRTTLPQGLIDALEYY